MILNTEATGNMTRNKGLFAKITLVTNECVILGDRTTKVPVLNIGIIYINIGSYFI